MAHTETGVELMKRFIESVSEFGTTEKAPVMDGRKLSTTISPVKAK